MYKYSVNHKAYGKLLRVNKAKARNLYNQGETIFLLGHKIVPSQMWYPCPIERPKNYGVYTTFDAKVDNFTFYNCDYERGYYPAFYRRCV